MRIGGLSSLPAPRNARTASVAAKAELEKLALANRHKSLNLEWLTKNRRLFGTNAANPYAMSWLDEETGEDYFGYGGLECVLLRNGNGCWEGYLCVPQFFWLSQPSFAGVVAGLRVHGGVTHLSREDGFLVVGFDTSHLEPGCDPSGETTLVDFFPVSFRFEVRPSKNERYRTLSYCRDQLENLASQVLAYGAVSRSARLLQTWDWHWTIGGLLFPGASVDSRGRLVFDVSGGVGVADILALMRDFLRGRQREERATRRDADLTLAEGLDALLARFPRDENGDFPDDFGSCLDGRESETLSPLASDLSRSTYELPDLASEDVARTLS